MTKVATLPRAHGALRYRLSGDPEGPAVLLIHGAGMHGGWWAPIVERLPTGLRLIVPDLRGHGASDWAAPGAYGIEDFADDLAALLEAVAAGPVAVVGHSMGGRVALWLAAHHPAKVAALALLDTRISALHPERIDRWRGVRAGSGTRRAEPTRAAAMARFRITPDEPGVDPELVAALAGDGVVERAPGEWTLRFDRSALGLEGTRMADLSPLLSRIDCPTLVVRGDVSTVAGERNAAALADGRAHVRVAVVPGGHHFALSHPSETAALLAGVLADPAWTSRLR